tara:strand:+ start:321 stop:1589 length:1269 start_codon:yes stop_codon:yes gene_type:complete
MKHLIALLLVLSPSFVTAQSCDLPLPYGGLNTGTNMSILLHQDFISALELNGNAPYIVAITANGFVVGSISLVDENGELVNQEAIAVWGDDTTTPDTDGAITGETIVLKIIDGSNLFNLNTSAINFTGNGLSVLMNAIQNFECTGIVMGCNDSDACNFNVEANENDGSCEYPLEFYNCNGECNTDSDGDGICNELEILGCVEPMACNYNPLATDVSEDCLYPEPYRNCDGDCTNDLDDDGICDEEEIEGCTNYFACNYTPDATDDDNSCVVVTAEIIFDSENELLTIETTSDSLEITWLYYNAVIPFEHNDSLYLLEDGVYEVLVFDPENDCGASDTIHINVVGLNEQIKPQIKLFPNPASSVLNLKLEQETEVLIFNALGKLMFQQNTKEQSINIETYPVGVYFIKLVQNNKRFVYPWVKE